MVFFKEWLPRLLLDKIENEPVVLLKGVPNNIFTFTANEISLALEMRVEFLLFNTLTRLEEYLEKTSLQESNLGKGNTIIVGSNFDTKQLIELGYLRVSRVSVPGEYSIYGDVIVVWIAGWSSPVRVSLFGQEVESIELVELESLKSNSKLTSLMISSTSGAESMVDDRYVANTGATKSCETKFLFLRNGTIPDSDLAMVDLKLATLPIENQLVNNELVIGQVIDIYKKQGYGINYVSSYFKEDKHDIEKYKKLFDKQFATTKADLGNLMNRGFVSNLSKQVYFTDYELFGEFNLSDSELTSSYQNPLALKQNTIAKEEIFKKIAPGDYVVHEDHGVGLYVGLIEKEGITYLDLAYAGQDRLYVPISQAKKVTKYVGGGKKEPILTPLNSGVWRRVKRKADEDAEAIAKELVQLYALRSMSKSVAYVNLEHDMPKIEKFIDDFKFTDTTDQMAATYEILQDLSAEMPMDRLIVGDVGFGKTEVAMRAIFAILNAGYQVALLAPTTILVEQHLSVLLDRFKGYGFKIASMSRFLTSAEVNSVVKRLEEGDIDLIIGTHSLLSENVKFKNLGLVVVDEEQKFGVHQKERLKERRVDSHILSMTATPIPRTLNMSLSGIRDISIIATPPTGRKAIKNSFAKFDWELVKKAVSQELDRKGQVYFLHNRVKDLESYKTKLRELFPDKVVERAHGQLDPEELSLIMHEFSMGNIDILVCTTIIENGIDLPNVNTLVVNKAERFGLSQLYQIRGRVGRSPKQGYAYFLYSNLRGDANLRMEALANSEALGSGFMLASHDLEIRGAGNLLGKAQSGVISSVGYGLYISMLNEKIDELRQKLS